MSMYKANAKMTGHMGVAVKGPAPNWRAEYAAEGADVNQEIHEGSLISLNTDGKFVLGCEAGTAGRRYMPMWSCKDISNAGVVQFGGNVFAGYYHGLVATGGFEIETSEFVPPATSSDKYVYNDLLKPAPSIKDEDGKEIGIGKVTKAAGDAYGAFPVVGVVSRPPQTNKTCECQTIRFWTMFLPAGE